MNTVLSGIIHCIKNIPGWAFEKATGSDKHLTWGEKERRAEKGLGKKYNLTTDQKLELTSKREEKVRKSRNKDSKNLKVRVAEYDPKIFDREKSSFELEKKPEVGMETRDEPGSYHRVTSGKLYDIVAAAAKKQSEPMVAVYIVEDDNNYAAAHKPSRSVVFSTGKLMKANDSSLEFTAAHEIKHFGQQQVAVSSIINGVQSLAAGMVGYYGYQFYQTGFKGASGVMEKVNVLIDTINNSNHVIADAINKVEAGHGAGLITASLFITLSAASALVVRRSRLNEYDSDKAGAEFAGKPAAVDNFKGFIAEREENKRELLQRANPDDAPVINVLFKILEKFGSHTHPSHEARIDNVSR